MIQQKCSNCGKENDYTKEEWKGREFTLCKHCNHTLSICNGFLEEC